MAKKILINGCVGCNSCVAICPEMFEMTEKREVVNIYGDDYEIPEDLEPSVIEAIDACPVNALALYE